MKTPSAMMTYSSPASRCRLLGVGDFFKGDYGIGGHCVDIFSGRGMANRVELQFLNRVEARRHAVMAVAATSALFTVAGLGLGLPPGSLTMLDAPSPAYEAHVAQDASGILQSLHDAAAFAAIEHPQGFSLRVAVFEPLFDSGFRLSPAAKKVLRTIIQEADAFFSAHGQPSLAGSMAYRVHRLPLLRELV